MRICLILEGSYPYVRGGVSSWTNGYIKSMPEHEFVLWLIGSDSKKRGIFKYEIPENVVEIHEVFLDDALKAPPVKKTRKNQRLNELEIAEHKKLIQNQVFDLEIVTRLYNQKKMNINTFLMSDAFLDIILEMCHLEFPYVPMTELFHTMRSMFLPALYMMSQEVPYADVYHAVSTGYAGLLGAAAKVTTNKPFIITEHGIYTREREEEVIRAEWISPYFKQHWIDLFYMIARLSYQHASSVTSLFESAKNTQRILGCDNHKLKVIRNGIQVEQFRNIPLKEEDDYIDIGAIVRFHPIKDIKTMIYAFFELKRQVPKARLHILGDVDDPEYYQECTELIKILKIPDILIQGTVDVRKYLELLDFTILTSISEGQPLSIIESLAARRPCITTDVGCCKELLGGTGNDRLGEAGLIVPPMFPQRLAAAMEKLCNSPQLQKEMGEIGRQRVLQYYDSIDMINQYQSNYQELVTKWQESVLS